MKAAVLRAVPGQLQIEELELDAPLPAEVRIRTAYAGLCHSDLKIVDGRFPSNVPVVMGHEAAGVVEAVGARVTYVQPGDHVITCLSSFCGECRFCLVGRPNLCSARSSLSARPRPSLHDDGGEPVAALVGLGAFAESMLVHERSVVKVRRDMPLDVAALIGCGVTTGMGAVLRTAKVEPGSAVAVIGCGGIGLSAVQAARIVGASRIIAVDVSPAKLQQALTMGATDAVDATRQDAVAAVRALSGGGVDYSFEAVGAKHTAEQSFAMLGPAGTATVIGLVPPDQTLDIPAGELYLLEKRLQGSTMGSNRFRLDMPWYCDLYMAGRLRLDEMVTSRRSLEDINAGFDEMRRGEGGRTLVRFASTDHLGNAA